MLSAAVAAAAANALRIMPNAWSRGRLHRARALEHHVFGTAAGTALARRPRRETTPAVLRLTVPATAKVALPPPPPMLCATMPLERCPAVVIAASLMIVTAPPAADAATAADREGEAAAPAGAADDVDREAAVAAAAAHALGGDARTSLSPRWC